ncbi:MAG TPA: hypothetical protein VFK65_09285, partial [Candidatus Binatia bacterium]|nr:hypothetical protein [Candidatus Binatia bacterium]
GAAAKLTRAKQTKSVAQTSNIPAEIRARAKIMSRRKRREHRVRLVKLFAPRFLRRRVEFSEHLTLGIKLLNKAAVLRFGL